MRKFLSRKVHPSWSFYAWVWGVIGGIIIGVCFSQSYGFTIAVIAIVTLFVVISWRYSCGLVLLLSVLGGFMLGNYRVNPALEGKLIMNELAGQTVTLSGKLSEDPDDSKGSTVIRLQDLAVITATGDVKVTGTMYIALAGTEALERSDMVTLRGKLGTGFGTFVATMYRPELIAIERSETGDIFARFKHWFAEKVRDFIPSPEVDLGLGYLMGMKSGLSEDFTTALQTVGMTHVVVASGAHLAILTGAAKKIFGKISKFAGVMFALLMILLFVLIVGFTPSMTRAALVASLSLVVGYVGRKFTPLRLIGFVAMLTLLIEPTNLLNLGWQLSFASFFGILVVGPRLQKVLYGGKKPPWLASMLITSIATSCICAPILIYNFGSFSLLALVANLIILPTLPYAMLGMMLTGVTSILPWMASVIGTLTGWLLDLHIWVVNFLSEQQAFILTLPAGDARFYLLYLPVAIFLLWPAFMMIRKKIFSKKQKIDTAANDSAIDTGVKTENML